MDIRVKAIHFDVNERLHDFIQKKVGKLGRFDEEIGKVEVSLKVVKPESAMNKQVDIRADVPGKSLFASETCDTFEEAIDIVKNINKENNNDTTFYEFTNLINQCLGLILLPKQFSENNSKIALNQELSYYGLDEGVVTLIKNNKQSYGITCCYKRS